MERVGILIVGAGPTGLGAAWRLNGLGHRDWLLCEAEQDAGGLASSVLDEHGFTWDLGGHVQFSHYEHFDGLMDDLLGPDGWFHHERESWIWVRGGFVPYPFQLNLHRLPPAERDACLEGLAQRSTNGRWPAHFGEWIDQSFGLGIARVFLRPYNFKVWAYPPEELAWSWIGDRVAMVDMERVRDNVRLGRDDIPWGPNTRFRFPKRGGTGVVWRTLAARLRDKHPGRLQMGRTLVRLDTAGHTAHFADGGAVVYERLLSTLPLDTLVGLSDIEPALGPVLRHLRYSSTHVIGIGLHGRPGPHLGGKCWIYFPEDDCPFYRVTVFSHYSPSNVPDATRYWSLMAEVSESDVKVVDAGRVVEDTVEGLVRTGLIPGREAVHHVWHRRLEHGYPTPSLHYDRALDVALPALEAYDVYSRGRFGAWKYEVSNQDHSFAQGVEAVEHWLLGAREMTLHEPETVNARRPTPRSAEALS